MDRLNYCGDRFTTWRVKLGIYYPEGESSWKKIYWCGWDQLDGIYQHPNTLAKLVKVSINLAWSSNLLDHSTSCILFCTTPPRPLRYHLNVASEQMMGDIFQNKALAVVIYVESRCILKNKMMLACDSILNYINVLNFKLKFSNKLIP